MYGTSPNDPPERLLSYIAQVGDKIHQLPTWVWVAAAAIVILWVVARGSKRARTF